MSDEQNSQEDSGQAEAEAGITQVEQSPDTQTEPAQQSSGEMMQADYTRKTKEHADNVKAFQEEQQAFYQQQSQNQQQGYTQQPQQVAQSLSQMNDQQLVDQFGYEGAQVMKQQNQALESKFNNMQFQMLYGQEEGNGKQKYGEEWDKHNYVDKTTGQMKNAVMDLRLATNPLTGQSLTLEQAWAAANPNNSQQIQQKATDAAYAEINQKQINTPAAASNAQPQSTGQGHAQTVREAYEQAKNSL